MLVDEYQDTSPAQQTLLKVSACARQYEIFAVEVQTSGEVG